MVYRQGGEKKYMFTARRCGSVIVSDNASGSLNRIRQEFLWNLNWLKALIREYEGTA
jgi:hypothetical protein